MKILYTLAFTALFGSSFAQSFEKCGTMHKLQNNPIYAEGVINAEMEAQRWINQNQHTIQRNDEVYTIPVVVHVIYSEQDETQNIHDSIIQSQIDVLNEDFARLNADAINTRSIFDTVAADTRIRFELASTDPEGNPTTGITRTATNKESFDIITDGQESMKSSASGGVDAWPTNKYLNLWSCKMTFFGIENSLLGFAQFPSTMPEEEGGMPDAVAETDGVVINYLHFGRTYNPAIAPSNLGRTATHEVGHWLGLRHIWADEDDPFSGAPGDCTQDDFVDDTPISNQRSNFECDHERNACSNDSLYSNGFWTNNPPDMVENYMDYSGDDCMNLFTKGQTERMLGFLLTARKDLLGDNTSVSDFSSHENINLYPNPANNSITLDLNSNHTGVFILTNTVGQVILSETITSPKTTINTQSLPNGIYYASFTNGERNLVKPIVIAH